MANTQAMEALKNVARNQSTQAETKQESSEKAFYSPFHGYVSFLTPKGTPFTFFNSHLVTSDAEVIEAATKLAGVKEVELTDKIPRPPLRKQGRARTADIQSATVISPLELLTRAVGNSTHVPQSAESSSTTSN